MELNYTPIHEVTRQFHLSDAPRRWVCGPVGSGKSYAICWEVLIRAARQAPSPKTGKRRTRVLFIRGSGQQLLDSVLPILREVFPEGPVGAWVSSTRTYQIRMADIECDILLRPLEDIADIKRVLSINASFVVFDEWRELPYELIPQVAARAGRFPPVAEEGCTFAGAFGASNPPMVDSDWWVMLEEERPDNTQLFKLPSARSPEATWRQFLPPGYYEDLMEGATEDFIRVMIDGEYGRSLFGRAVYEKTFVEGFHNAAQPLQYLRDQSYPLCVGMDFGRTPSAVIGQLDARGRLLVLSDVSSENMGLDTFLRTEFKPHMASNYPGMPYYVVGDPAGWAKSQLSEESVGDVFRRHNIVAVRAPTNDVAKRLEAVEQLLSQQRDGRAMFLVDPRCTHVLKGFRGAYKYRRKTDGTFEARPQKDDASHIADAVQYLALGVSSPVQLRAAHRRDTYVTQQGSTRYTRLGDGARVQAAAWT